MFCSLNCSSNILTTFFAYELSELSITKISKGFFVCVNKEDKQLLRCSSLLNVGIITEILKIFFLTKILFL